MSDKGLKLLESLNLGEASPLLKVRARRWPG
jgi:hypothetical protein